jgi:hypothetical protein
MYGIKEFRWKRSYRRGTNGSKGMCFECKEKSIEVYTKPTGGWYTGGRGLCVECYERAIRRHGTFKRKINGALDFEESVTQIF